MFFSTLELAQLSDVVFVILFFLRFWRVKEAAAAGNAAKEALVKVAKKWVPNCFRNCKNQIFCTGS